MSKKINYESLRSLKKSKKSIRVFVLTLDNNIFISKSNSMMIFEKQSDCEKFIKQQDKNYNFDYITMWLNNVEVY